MRYAITTFHICIFAMRSEIANFFHWFVSDMNTEFWVGVYDQAGLGLEDGYD